LVFLHSPPPYDMELLLNILWAALALPALWMRRSNPACAGWPHRFARYRTCLVLGCALVLLFPVVSATDDLHAMRPEMEESSFSKRCLKQSVAAKSIGWTHATGAPPPEFIALSLRRRDDMCGLVFLAPTPLPELAPFSQRDSRAPPVTSLS